ncbi:unnamed protein product [Trifolium pratense]|uniref:Uncharacterized protein n=1 Tax=Trifolium pratense TaxID=57577 RepID=A0ACB0JNI7_TRIPR|nr:unnamed protein product [Trifolium pratense]
MAQIGNTSQILVDTIDVFTTDQKFATPDVVLTWARDVGDANKVSIIITRSDKKNGIRGRNDKLVLGCDKGGKYDSSESSTTTASKKCNCPFKIRAAPSTGGSGWKVQVIHGVHNHGLPDQYHGHPRKARLTTDENKRVQDLTKRKVAPRHIVLDLKDQNPESVVDATLVYRKRHMMQIQERGSRTELQHLLQLLDDAKYVSWNRRKDDGSDVLSDIFWAHPDSIKLLNLFPIVLVMDRTYKTNKYRQPLLEITGITSTNMAFAVGFAYMESEKTDNYHWALGKLKELITKQDIFPRVILTDREFALMNAIKDIFPHTTNMLCTWHIIKNVNARCTVHIPKDMRQKVKNLWRDVVESPDEVEYQQRLNAFQQACVNSSKVESAHWKLKQMLEHSKGDLCKSLKGMNDNIRLEVDKIKKSFQKSFYYAEKTHISPFFQYLRNFVSRAAMTLISDEMKRIDIVGTDKNLCGCKLRSTCELPCACELSGYTTSGVPIPLDSVHGHWKKLTMEEPLEDDIEDGYELDMSNAMEAIWTRFRSLDIVGKRALKSKVFELAYPASSSLCPPPEKIKTRGGVKNKDKGKAPKGYDVYRDPSYFEHVEREYGDSQGTSKRLRTQLSQPSQEQQSQPSQKQLSQMSKKLTSQKYLGQFPDHLHPHIVDIIEVLGDGNCGFRAVAYLLGYTEEANRYNVILVTLGKPSQTFFPMMTSYSSSARFFCFGFVSGNHWVPVNMSKGFPLPEVTADWKKFRSHEATSWMSNLNGRLQYWQLLNPPVKPPSGVMSVD